MKPKRALLVLMMAGSSVLALELVSVALMLATKRPVRRGPFLSERHSYDPYRGHRLNPAYRHRRDTEGRAIHSPDGFREDGGIPKAKPAGEFRIIVMGGSALYGLGSGEPYPWHRSLRNDETVDYFLERLLNEESSRRGLGLRVRVVNAAVTAYQTFQHLVYLNSVLYAYQPDLVVFLDGHNDFYIARETYNHWLDYSYSSVLWAETFNEARPALAAYASVRALSLHSFFFTLLEDRLKQLDLFVQPAGAEPESLLRPGVELPASYARIANDTFLRAYAQIQALGRKRDFETIVFLQPEMIFEAAESLSLPDREILSITTRYRSRDKIELRRAIRQLLPDLFRRQELEFHDLGEIGAPSLELYLDYCHLTPEGSLAVARRMIPAVSEVLARRQARAAG